MNKFGTLYINLNLTNYLKKTIGLQKSLKISQIFSAIWN